MEILKIASFSHGNTGGNPAGVALCDHLPEPEEMQALAKEVGFSETAFAAPNNSGSDWRVRYFSPESEVPFCGHATIALGAALALSEGNGVFSLKLNNADITVEGKSQDGLLEAALQSPPTKSALLSEAEIEATLELFGYQNEQLNLNIKPALIHAGADHYLIALKNREDLSRMAYNLDAGRTSMLKRGLITVMLVHHESEQQFNVRNAFASGGVVEDPATGAAAAAFSGYLRDTGWNKENKIQINQGEDMGVPSIINTECSSEPTTSIRVSGSARIM